LWWRQWGRREMEAAGQPVSGSEPLLRPVSVAIVRPLPLQQEEADLL
jgi:hypothetical protein